MKIVINHWMFESDVEAFINRWEGFAADGHEDLELNISIKKEDKNPIKQNENKGGSLFT